MIELTRINKLQDGLRMKYTGSSGHTRRTVRSVTTTPHTATRPRNASLVAVAGNWMLSAAAWFFLQDDEANSGSWWTPERPSASFRTATVYRPILGLDFLSTHGLLVGRQVLDLKSLKPLSKPPAATAGRQRSIMIVYVINAFAYFC